MLHLMICELSCVKTSCCTAVGGVELPTSEFTVLYFSILSRSNAIAGETSLDRLANALGGKSVLPHIISSIPGMLQSGVCIYMYVCILTKLLKLTMVW